MLALERGPVALELGGIALDPLFAPLQLGPALISALAPEGGRLPVALGSPLVRGRRGVVARGAIVAGHDGEPTAAGNGEGHVRVRSRAWVPPGAPRRNP